MASSGNTVSITITNALSSTDAYGTVTQLAQTLAAGSYSFAAYYDGASTITASIVYTSKLTISRNYEDTGSSAVATSMILENCDTSITGYSSGAITISTSAIDSTLPIAAFTVSKTRGAKDDWSFTFSTGSSKTVFTNEAFVFGLGWINVPHTTY